MTFRPEEIPLAAQRFCSIGELPTFLDNTLAHPLSGGHCQIYKLRLPDQTICAVRVPIHASSAPKDTRHGRSRRYDPLDSGSAR